MSKVPDLLPDDMTPEQRKVYDAIASGPRATVQGPLRVWLHSPQFAHHAQALGAYCRYATALEPRLSELAILVVGGHWRAGFEWAVHAPIAIAAGVAPEAAEAIRTGRPPALDREDEQVVYDFTRELVEERKVSDPVYARAVAAFGVRGTVDLVGIIGYYTLISMSIVAFDVDLPPEADDPFADLQP